MKYFNGDKCSGSWPLQSSFERVLMDKQHQNNLVSYEQAVREHMEMCVGLQREAVYHFPAGSRDVNRCWSAEQLNIKAEALGALEILRKALDISLKEKEAIWAEVGADFMGIFTLKEGTDDDVDD